MFGNTCLKLAGLLGVLSLTSCGAPAPVAPGSFVFEPGVTYLVAQTPVSVPNGVLGNAGFCPTDAEGAATATLGIFESPACRVSGEAEGPLGVHSRFSLAYTHVALADGSTLYIGKVSRLLNSPMVPGTYTQIYRANTAARPGYVEGDHPVLEVELGAILNAGRLGNCREDPRGPWPVCSDLRTIPQEEFTALVRAAVPGVDMNRLRPGAMKIERMVCEGNGRAFTTPGRRCAPASP